MGSALRLLIGGPALAYTAAFALLSLALQVWEGNYPSSRGWRFE